MGFIVVDVKHLPEGARPGHPPGRRRPRPAAVASSSATPPINLLLMAAPPPPAAPAAGQHSVFVYGTLMAEEVVRVLLGRAPPSSPALLPGHRRFSLRGRVYPAILPVPGHAVNGKVRLSLNCTPPADSRSAANTVGARGWSCRLKPLPLSALLAGFQGAHRQGTPCVRLVRGRGVSEENC